MTDLNQISTDLAILLKNFYRRETGLWYTDSNSKEVPANEEQTKEFQAKVRALKFALQAQHDDKLVTDFADKGIGDETVFLKLLPLVSRRRHPELWLNIRKEQPDGNLFSFKAPTYICNCPDEELFSYTDNSDTLPSLHRDEKQAHQKLVEEQRQLHNNWLTSDKYVTRSQYTSIICFNPIEVWQAKHTIGNWNCKTCLNLGQEIESSEDVNNALASSKGLEWCPRFFPILRKLPFSQYLKQVKSESGNATCYAGLLHSELTFETEMKVHPGFAGHSDGNEPSEVHCAVVTKKCDSCNFTEVVKKEYTPPVEVESNSVLQVIE